MDRHTHPCQDVLAGTGVHNPKAENCIKTLKVEAVYLMDYETFADVTADLPPALARESGHSSPLVTYACPAASAEQVRSPVNIT